MKIRVRNAVKILKVEKELVLRFVLEQIEKDEGHLPLMEIFAGYKKWLAQEKCAPSRLSVDGFGRLFPKGFERARLYTKGKLAHCVKGIRFNGKERY